MNSKTSSEQTAPRRRRLRLQTLFSLIAGGIVLLSVGSIVVLSIVNARQDLIRGLATEFDLIIGGMTDRVGEQLSQVSSKHDQLAAWIREQPHLAANDQHIGRVLRAAAAGSEHTTAIAFLRLDRTSVRFDQRTNKTIVNDLSERSDIIAVLNDAIKRGPAGRRLNWSSPLFSPNLNRTIIVHRQAVWSSGELIGLLFSAIDLSGLSKYVSDLSNAVGDTVFILYGRDKVLAHPTFQDPPPLLSVEKPLPSIDDVPDARLQFIWRDDRAPVISQAQMKRSKGHYIVHDGQWQVFVYGNAGTYGGKPWFVGFHFDTSSRGSQVVRFWIAAVAGGILLMLLTLLGLWLGRRIAQPIQQLVNTASAVEQLDFSKIRALPPSRIYELDRASIALNRMIAGLQVFERYVPKPLVRSIIREGPDSVQPDERIVTVMFADIVGFTSIAETLTPRQSADLLNQLFGDIGACIEETGGTVDKYIGDGLLAFWGAPERTVDHATRACHAALAVASKLGESSGNPHDVRLRIGLHTGPAIVGDIGGELRINYTAIGDTVNIASRIEDLARNFMQGSVTVIVTDSTRTGAGPTFHFEALGTVVPSGRSGSVEISRLVGN